MTTSPTSPDGAVAETTRPRRATPLATDVLRPMAPRPETPAPSPAPVPVRGRPRHAPPRSGTVRRRLRGVRAQLADPLTFNGYTLIANSAVTGGLGLVYWLLMARLYPTAAVGIASAAYAAMNLLAGITAQSFNGALTRFIPQAGLRTRTFIVRSYAVSVVASIGVAVVFVLTIRSWGSTYSELGGPVTGVVFVACVAAWAIFTIQDSVLVGLRGAFWVLVENGIFGVVKLVLLVALVTALPRHLGIYVSWMLPAVVAVPLINALIFGRLVPRHTALTRDFRPPSNRQIGRFLAGDYSGALCLLATGSLIPVVVAARTDARQTAYFFVAWVMSGMVGMIGVNMGMSLTVEGAFDAGALAANCRRALRKMTVLLAPCSVLLALFAPVWLRLFGSAYATHATSVLELLAAATIPTAVTELYLGALRAQNRTSLVALVQSARGVVMLALTVVLTGSLGTVGAGVAVLVSQSAIALLTSVGLWHVLTGRRNRTVALAEEPAR